MRKIDVLEFKNLIITFKRIQKIIGKTKVKRINLSNLLNIHFVIFDIYSFLFCDCLKVQVKQISHSLSFSLFCLELSISLCCWMYLKTMIMIPIFIFIVINAKVNNFLRHCFCIQYLCFRLSISPRNSE